MVDTLQVCVTFRDMYASYNERVYELEGHDPRDEAQARAKIREWDYRSDGPVALGTLSVRDRPVFGEQFLEYGAGPVDLDAALERRRSPISRSVRDGLLLLPGSGRRGAHPLIPGRGGAAGRS